LALNSRIPRLALSGLGGEKIDTSSTEHKMLLFVFVDAQCPCVVAYTRRMQALNKAFRDKGLQTVYVFANPLDSVDAVRRFVNTQRISWFSVIDTNQRLAKLFRAKTTTQACLIDLQGVFRYSGRIDDSVYGPGSVKNKDLENAIRSLLANGAVARRQFAATGCEIDLS
jgi:hypothetical protein